MIGVQLQNGFITLQANASIRLEKTFPILQQILYQGDWSFPFNIPVTDDLLRTLGFVNLIEVKERTLTYDCHIYLFGMPYKPAKFIITKATNKFITVNIASGFKSLVTAEKSLREINYGPDFYLGKYSDEIAATATDISREGDWSVNGFTFVPHANEDFYSGNNDAFNGVLNAVNPNTGNIHYNTISTGNKYAIVPFMFLHFVLKKIFEEEGLEIIGGSYWDHPEMQKKLLYNNRSIDSLQEIGGTLVKPFQDEQYALSYSGSIYASGENLRMIKGIANTYDEPFAYDNASKKYVITATGQYTMEFHMEAKFKPNTFFYLYLDGVELHHWSYLVLPNTDAQNFYHASGFVLTHTFNCGVPDVGKELELKVFSFASLSPVPYNVEIYSSSYIKITQSNVDEINYFDNYVRFKNHMKDMSVSSFLLAVKATGVNFKFDYTAKTVRLDFEDDIINASTTIDWTDKVESEYELSLDDFNKGYKVSYDFGSSDKLTEGNFIKTKLPISAEFNTINERPNTYASGSFVYIKNTNELYVMNYEPISNTYTWVKYSDYYYDQVYLDGKNEVKLAMSPMFMGIAKNPEPGGSATLETALMPIAKQSGSSDMFGLGDNDFDLRVCFYRGQNVVGNSPNNKGGNYIYAGTTIYGLNGNIVGDWDFTLHLPTSVYKKYQEPLFERSATGMPVERNLRLNEHDVLTIDEKQKVIIDGIPFLNLNISILIENNKIKAKGKMLKL